MKRIVASTLWVLAVWNLGTVLAQFAGLPGSLGPILGLCAGVLVAADPKQVIWSRAVNDRP